LPRLGAHFEPLQVSLDPADLAVLSSPPHPAHSGPLPRPAPESAWGDPADCADGRMIQHATYLPALLNDPYDFGRIAAAHALVRLHAADTRPWTAVAIVTPPDATQASARADVMALLHGATEILSADGAELVDCAVATDGVPGISLVLAGRVAPLRDVVAGPTAYPTLRHPALRDPTLRLGDALILTKPLGSAIILEGYRRGLAQACWLLDALAVMTASSAAASRILRQHGAAACAAVAEHGVVGTLAAVLRDANLAAVLSADGILALPGARELARLGVARPAADENRQAWPDPPDWPDLALLTDPQIAGGLLAGVPETLAADCLAALRAAGYAAARIGQTEARRLDAPRLRLDAIAVSATANGETT
jgi:selenide,water dikinase